MGKSNGPVRVTGLLIAMICCLSAFTLISGPRAGDFADIPACHHDAWWMRFLGCEGNTGLQDEIHPWLIDDEDLVWTCPRCGAEGNIFLITGCLRCGYARGNPEEYLLMPVRTECVTNGYSREHRAVDFGVPEGTPVLAAEDGIVTQVIEHDRWRGNVLRISHGGGLETLYGHLQEILVPLDGYVRTGELIALSGKSGACTGPHLHFEVYLHGQAEDPFSHLGPWQ